MPEGRRLACGGRFIVALFFWQIADNRAIAKAQDLTILYNRPSNTPVQVFRALGPPIFTHGSSSSILEAVCHTNSNLMNFPQLSCSFLMRSDKPYIYGSVFVGSSCYLSPVCSFVLPDTHALLRPRGFLFYTLHLRSLFFSCPLAPSP